MEFKTKGGCVEWAAHKSTSPLSHIKAAKLSHRRYIIHTQYHTPHSLFHTWLLPWPGLFPEPIHGIVCPLLHRRPPLRTLPKPPPPAAAVGNVVAPAPPPPPCCSPCLPAAAAAAIFAAVHRHHCATLYTPLLALILQGGKLPPCSFHHLHTSPSALLSHGPVHLMHPVHLLKLLLLQCRLGQCRRHGQ